MRAIARAAITIARGIVALPYAILTGRFSEQQWWAIRRLHPLTNGRSTDGLRRIVRARRPSAQLTGAVSPLFGPVDPAVQEEIVATVRARGWSAVPFALPERIVADLVAHTRTVSGTPRPMGPEAVVDFEQPQAPAYWFTASRLAPCEAYRSIVCDPVLADLARRHLGVEPVLSSCQAWWSFPTGEASTENAQLYHYDLDHPAWLKFFVYLTDVDEDTGPHCLVQGTHRRDAAGAGLRKRVRFTRVPDDAIHSTYPGQEQVFTAPAGTILAVDTRAWHKGMPPRTGPRLAMEVYFSDCIVGALPLEEQIRAGIA